MILLFSATMFVAATLLFLVQPMVGKMVLPLFGGTPAVWNTCMVFFQAALLAGYGYAHLMPNWFSPRRQVPFHLALLLAPLLLLPIGLDTSIRPPSDNEPVLWLLWQLSVTVGLPFAVVATSAPLLQRWFVATGHPAGRDPYFLYAAGNTGSLLALIGYPLLLEPVLRVADQTLVWSAGYVLLVVMVACCGAALWRKRNHSGGDAHQIVVNADAPIVTPSVRRRLWWLACSLVPSSLMLGVTSYTTTNLAAVPLLWVLPLALYLVTFILVFAAHPPIPHRWMTRLLPFVIVPVAILTFLDIPRMTWMLIPAHLFMFFVAAMVCHGELARTRPHQRHLTEFYLLMSVGGVLGGAFNAIVAPLVFDSVMEYPLMMVLVCLLLPAGKAIAGSLRDRKLDLALPAVLAVVAVVMIFGISRADVSEGPLARAIIFGIPAVVCFGCKERPVRFALCFAVVLFTVSAYADLQHGQSVYTARNFFGVKKVVVEPGGSLRTMVHGRTRHGCQALDPAMRREPLAYYHRSGPAGDVFSHYGFTNGKNRVAVIGLGVGSMACYVQPGQQFTFYEIDPGVRDIAMDPSQFTFMAECAGTCEVVIGDGRLAIADAPDQSFDIVVLDAFSSDAIPTHLLSAEAVQGYLDKLAPDGLILMHISNVYLDLEPVVARLAENAGLACWSRKDLAVNQAEQRMGKLPSHYVVLARTTEHISELTRLPDWHRVKPDQETPLWTDQYSSLLPLMRW